MLMAQDEYILRCGYSGVDVSSCRSKKMKQKKVPQRGLGVAQLEKMIMEEQQKKAILAKNTFGSLHGDFDTTSFLALCPSLPDTEFRHENSDAGEGELVVSEGGLSPRHENWPKPWNGEYNPGGEDMTCHNLIGFEPHVKLAYESNAPILPQRSHKFQRPPPSSCSSLVKSSSGISSVISTQMELPSIQTFLCKSYALTEENKIIGMKRSYPFSLESPPSSSLERNFHMEPRNKLIRESISNSSPPERNLNELTSDNLRLNGDFLTLAPPSVVASPPLDHSGCHRHTLYEIECIRIQEYGENQIHRPGPSGLVENYFNFFPIKLQTYKTAANVSSGKGEKGETIDLNLKL